jgi:hypothetical protein
VYALYVITLTVNLLQICYKQSPENNNCISLQLLLPKDHRYVKLERQRGHCQSRPHFTIKINTRTILDILQFLSNLPEIVTPWNGHFTCERSFYKGKLGQSLNPLTYNDSGSWCTWTTVYSSFLHINTHLSWSTNFPPFMKPEGLLLRL